MRRRWVLRAVFAVLVVLMVGKIRANTIAAAHPSASPSVLGAHGAADPEVAKGLAAFSGERYGEARRIAEAMLAERNRGSTHAEALDLMVESWLAEGNFGQARAAAHRYQDEARAESAEALQRIDSQEDQYRRSLQKYEREKARAKQPQEAADVQVRIGLLHHRFGREDLARATYHEVVAQYPGTPAARRAERRLAALPEGPQPKAGH